MRNSIVDSGGDPEHLGRRIQDLTTRVEELEMDLAMARDIIFGHLPVAVCDQCHRLWFTFPRHMRPTGHEDGLLVGGGACCATPACLDALYEKSADLEDDEAARVFEQVADWFLRYRKNMNCMFGRDPLIRRLMRRLSP